MFVTGKFLYSQYRNKEENSEGTEDLFLYRRNFVKSVFVRTIFDCTVITFLSPATIGHVRHLGPNGHYFTWFYERMRWAEARKFCQLVGGDLAVLDTTILDQFVRDTFPAGQKWIGATDVDQEGQWIWVNGEKMQQGYWVMGEPNGGQEENCLLISKWRWHDGNCMARLKPLCEHPAWPKCSVLR